MPRPHVPDGRPLSDRPARPNAYRSGCAPEPEVVACRGPPPGVSSVQVIPQTNLRRSSPSHRCSYHIDGITPRQPLQTLKAKTFTPSQDEVGDTFTLSQDEVGDIFTVSSAGEGAIVGRRGHPIAPSTVIPGRDEVAN